ncbi:MAG: toll/interleukin-1 receptor domain-containing protein [Limnohabitans sp.]|nr:toll/interleukin-1 receptor domain-containing protein [Limnohabitans sp.]
MEETNPKVFISYSHDSKEHQDRVLKLSDELRNEGIDCSLDQYEDSPPEGWPKWMDRNVKNSDFVLVVCTETYYNRVMGTDEKGNGIKWESTLIYQQLYNAGSHNTKFIPVLFKDGKFENIPEPLQGATFYNVDDKDSYEKLYWRLRGQKTKKPELGKLRELPEKERKTLFISEFIKQSDWKKANWKNGVGYLWDENSKKPPVVILFFETMEKGKELFSRLINIIGQEDESERLRVSIVEGKVPNQKNGYFVLVGENIDVFKDFLDSKEGAEAVEFIAVNQRFHRIYVEGESPSLKKFKEEYKKLGYFYITCGIQNPKGSSQPFELDYDSMILKKEIEFRNYDEIPEQGDPDSVLKSKETQNHKF